MESFSFKTKEELREEISLYEKIGAAINGLFRLRKEVRDADGDEGVLENNQQKATRVLGKHSNNVGEIIRGAGALESLAMDQKSWLDQIWPKMNKRDIHTNKN